MALCPVFKIDSNSTSLYFAEEQCLKQLPTSPAPNWYGLEPNSYSDFGGEVTTTARAPIEASRQNKKGAVTDLEASGGFNTDLTQTNLSRLMQGFFYADAREPLSTEPMNSAKVPFASVTASSKTYAVAAGMPAFGADMLVYASGFAIAVNNGLKTVASRTATELVVDEVIVDELTPPAAARVDHVGYVFGTGDIGVSVVGGTTSLTATTADFTTMNFLAGQWIFVGGDASTSKFANNQGFARIRSVAAKALVLDDCEWNPVTEPGTGLDIQIFIPMTIRNERTTNLIKQRSFQFERTLGFNGGYEQAEYLEGCVANELVLNIPQAEKVTCDLSFLACSESQRSGAPGADTERKPGTRIAAKAEDAFNTTSNVRRIKMALVDGTAYPSPLFAYLTDATLTISNNAVANKAVGVLGAMAITAGNFVVTGSATAYFQGVSAKKAIRDSADVGLSVILSARNAGQIFDLPLLTLGGGQINVEKDAPVTIPLEAEGAENKFGYTASYSEFRHLPTAAMASALVT